MSHAVFTLFTTLHGRADVNKVFSKSEIVYSKIKSYVYC